MDRSLFLFTLKNSKRGQLVILLLTALALPFYYLSLEMPKIIINRVIGARDVEFPRALSVFGHELAHLEKLDWLLFLCLMFLLAVALHGAVKFWLNVYKGRLGERLLRHLRRELCARALRFPLSRFSRVSSDELNAMVTAEIDPLGGFIGDALALPALQSGLLFTAIAFIFVQNPWMGLAAVALFPVQGLVIPRLQRQVNALGRQRVLTVRRLATRFGEALTALPDIRSAGAAAHELENLDRTLGRILEIRYEIFKRKSFVKLLNNLLFQATPFLFLLVGGYLTLEGELTLGALLAVLAAYKDLPPPAKELLDYYQSRHDSQLKYEQVISQFELADLEPESRLIPAGEGAPGIGGEGTLGVRDLTISAEQGGLLVEQASFSLDLRAHTAILGLDEPAADALARSLVRLQSPDEGVIEFAGRELGSVPFHALARDVAFVGEQSAFFKGAVFENLRYGRVAGGDADDRAAALRAMVSAGLGADLVGMGLSAVITAEAHAMLAEQIVAARPVLLARLGAAAADLIEPLDGTRYNRHASVVENLIWGAPLAPEHSADWLSDHPLVLQAIRRAGFTGELVALGAAAAEPVVGALRGGRSLDGLGPERPLVHPDELAVLQGALDRVGLRGVRRLSRSQRMALVSVALRVVAAVHGWCPLSDALQQRIVAARRNFGEYIPASLKQQLAFFEVGRYNPALTVRENLIFGVLADDRPRAVAKVEAELESLIRERGLLEAVADAGLDFDVGIAGSALRGSQRQRLGLARAIFRQPRLLVICRPTSELDDVAASALVQQVLGDLAGRGIVWLLERPELARFFDDVIVFEEGRVREQGGYAPLARTSPALRRLLGASES